jgi:transposase-like protein
MDTMAGTDSKKRPRRRHTDEFRAGAVRLVLTEGALTTEEKAEQGGGKVAQVARDLDIAESLLHGWARQAKVDSGQGPPDRARHPKKAAAFFAKESV